MFGILISEKMLQQKLEICKMKQKPNIIWANPNKYPSCRKSWLALFYPSEYCSWKAAWGRVHTNGSTKYFGLPFSERYSPKLPHHEGLFNLILDIGLKPLDGKKYDIDRIDNDRGYVVGNVRWLETFENKSKDTIKYIVITFDDYPNIYVELPVLKTEKAFNTQLTFLNNTSRKPKKLIGINFIKTKRKHK